MRVPGSTFLVTGGGSGLGAACVRELLQGGADVVVADIQPGEFGGQSWYCRTDVADPADVAAAVAHGRRLDGVIHCAGMLSAARLLSRRGPHDLALFRRVIDVNLIGTFNVLRLAAERMASNAPDADGERGVMVLTGSVASQEGQVGQVAYAASKGGVAAMVLPAARELAERGIRVAAIAPGLFDTPLLASAPAPALAALQAQTMYPARWGRPEEFARFARAIIENPMVNGCLLRLDGAVRLNSGTESRT
ncbi:MAG: SDR family NAD(P)-dependent oxidoreductase [Pirellulaceae bacterium]